MEAGCGMVLLTLIDLTMAYEGMDTWGMVFLPQKGKKGKKGKMEELHEKGFSCGGAGTLRQMLFFTRRAGRARRV